MPHREESLRLKALGRRMAREDISRVGALPAVLQAKKGVLKKTLKLGGTTRTKLLFAQRAAAAPFGGLLAQLVLLMLSSHVYGTRASFYPKPQINYKKKTERKIY